MEIWTPIATIKKWAVITDDSGTYVAFDSKEAAQKWSDQFCPIGADGEGDMNVLILPEGHGLITTMGWTERQIEGGAK
jgi:hypothetical protein